MKTLIPTFLAVLFTVACSPKLTPTVESSPIIADNALDSLTFELKEIQAKGVINGFSVAIVDKKETLYQAGFGFADVAAAKEHTAYTL